MGLIFNHILDRYNITHMIHIMGGARMGENEPREIVQVNLRLFKDQLEPLNKLWKLKLLNSKSELMRIEIDRMLKENEDILNP